MIYYQGKTNNDGIPSSWDLFEAKNYFKEAVEKGSIYAKKALDAVDKHLRIEDLMKTVSQEKDPRALYQLGYKYMSENQPYEAVICYKEAAEQGYVEAQFDLASCYLYGIGVNKDLKQGIEWLKKAAEHQNLKALCNLGVCYRDGIGTGQDLEQAVNYFKQAADRGYVTAQFNLGACYYNKKDYSQSIDWYKKAAENGNVGAIYEMSLFYLYGIVVKKDLPKAIIWLRKVAGMWHEGLQDGLPSNKNFHEWEEDFKSLEDMIFWGDLRESILTETAINHPERKNGICVTLSQTIMYVGEKTKSLGELQDKFSNEYRILALAKRHAILGQQLISILDKVENPDKIHNMLNDVVDNYLEEEEVIKTNTSEDPKTQIQLGAEYLKNGNILKAVECFKKVASYRNLYTGEAKSNLAQIYETGIFPDINIEETITLFKEVIKINEDLKTESNSVMSRLHLGILYCEGRPHHQPNEGKKLIEEALFQIYNENGNYDYLHLNECYRIGMVYCSGIVNVNKIPTSEDIEKGDKFLRRVICESEKNGDIFGLLNKACEILEYIKKEDLVGIRGLIKRASFEEEFGKLPIETQLDKIEKAIDYYEDNIPTLLLSQISRPWQTEDGQIYEQPFSEGAIEDITTRNEYLEMLQKLYPETDRISILISRCEKCLKQINELLNSTGSNNIADVKSDNETNTVSINEINQYNVSMEQLENRTIINDKRKQNIILVFSIGYVK